MATIYVKEGTTLPAPHADDLYRTEHTLIQAALENLVPRSKRYDTVLDIGAGDGRWGAMARDWVTSAAGEHPVVYGVELQDQPQPYGFAYWAANTNFLDWQAPTQFDLIVSNPPYSLAEKMIRRAWTMLAPDGLMIMLLRQAFQSGMRRYNGLWNEIYPFAVPTLSRRPSFYCGGTNATDYSLFAWQKGYDGKPVGTPRQWNTFLIAYDREKDMDCPENVAEQPVPEAMTDSYGGMHA